ncbi:MAG: Uma2 family endonuclease [Pseudomonadota bacterium]|nr:Uma2 family endonuclease [Pseudomonadota bacterium]
MSEAGIFHEDDRVELIDGEIVKMAPIGSLHAGTVDQINHPGKAGRRSPTVVQVKPR